MIVDSDDRGMNTGREDERDRDHSLILIQEPWEFKAQACKENVDESSATTAQTGLRLDNFFGFTVLGLFSEFRIVTFYWSKVTD